MRRSMRSLILLGCATFAATAASAQPAPYPDRPVHVVVAYAAGGATDVIARAVAQRHWARCGASRS